MCRWRELAAGVGGISAEPRSAPKSRTSTRAWAPRHHMSFTWSGVVLEPESYETVP